MSIFNGVKNYLSFDGVDDYVDLGEQSILSIFNGSSYVEIEFDFELNVIKSDRQVIIEGLVQTIGSSFYIVSRNNGSLWVGGRSNANDNFQQLEFSSVLSANTKYNVRALYDYQNDEIKVWLDNILLGTQSVSFGSSTLTGDLNNLGKFDTIGSQNTNAGNYLDGNIYYLSITSNTTQVEYTFDEGTGTTLTDKVGNNDGTIVGATWDSLGTPLSSIYIGENKVIQVYKGETQVYQAPPPYLSFDGVNDYLVLPAEIIDFSQDWEIDMTLSFASYPNDKALVFGQIGNSGEEDTPRIFIKEFGILDMEIFSSNQLNVSTSTSNTKYNVRFVRTGNNIQSYLNGTLIVTKSFQNLTIVDTNTSIYIGTDFFDFPNEYFNGNIYDIKLYENNTLISHYDFKDGSGTTLTDIVGSNDGTIYGATWVE